MVTRKSIRKRPFMQVKILWRQMLLKHRLGFSPIAFISSCKREWEKTLILPKEAVKKCFQAYRCHMPSLSSGIHCFILAWKSVSPVLVGLDQLKDLSVLSLKGRKNDRFITTQISPQQSSTKVDQIILAQSSIVFLAVFENATGDGIPPKDIRKDQLDGK